MKSIFAILFVACLVIPTAFCQPAPPLPKSIAAADLNKIAIVGNLGVPLGTVVDIEATIVSGKSTRHKAYDGRYLLSITKIKGKAIEKPILTEFHNAPGDRANLANDTSALYELKKGKRTGRLSEKDVAEIEQDYVGKQLKLYVYESGRFDGMPEDMPDDLGGWQDYAFRFRTHLITLAQRP